MSVDLSIAPPRWAETQHPEELAALDLAFSSRLAQRDPGLAKTFADYRAGAAFSPLDESTLLIAVAQILGPFVAEGFGCADAVAQLRQTDAAQEVLWRFKRDFMGKRLGGRRRRGERPRLDPAGQQRVAELQRQWGGAADDPELRAAQTALAAVDALADLRAKAEPNDAAAEAAALADLQLLEDFHLGNAEHTAWLSYRTPQPIDPQHANLVPHQRPNPDLPEAQVAAVAQRRARQGFGLTDQRMDGRGVGAELDYCLLCHPRGKDSCRHGLRQKTGELKRDPKGVELAGCPLDERISEAHAVRRKGDPIGALAIICIDNPMCAGTGHRICNDCMKACVFQKQEPVDIPQVETGILTQVLALPYGFEIYSLLTRFNPLNRDRPYALPYRGIDVLVVGQGPAGYTLAHYLLNEGFGVVGIDALKIEPLPAAWVGGDNDGDGPPQPIADVKTLQQKLDERPVGGFGGVAEYGITVRWDKNFLRLLHLNLMRRPNFALFDGIRFGGTLRLEDVWKLGFAHVGLAAGAGSPTLVPMRHNLLRGMRFAADFLMGLQLGGAFKKDALANLQVELPALVVGGGLTAIDTATELLAYYPVQVERLLRRSLALGEAHLMAQLQEDERQVVQRMLEHGRILRQERLLPQPDLAGRLQEFGGVHVVYRRALSASPAYRLNHEEVSKALEEGIGFIENLSPLAAVPDALGHVDGLLCRRLDQTEVHLPARCVLLAAGTAPNVIYEKEYPGTFELDAAQRFFAAYRLADAATGDLEPSAAADSFFTSYRGPEGQRISFYGDNHPRYAGNVVKAMASAKHGHRAVAQLFAAAPGHGRPFAELVARLRAQLCPRVHAVHRLAPNIVDVVVHAPMQARQFKPGQFYRLQTYESLAPQRGGQPLLMEGLALTGAGVDREAGLLSMVALEMGVSSRLCALLQPGDPVVLMGPTGAPTEIPQNEKVILCGGGLGNAVLFSVAAAMRQQNNQIVYFAAYRKAEDLFRRSAIESCAAQVIWCTEFGAPITAERPQDRQFTGNIVQAMQAYAAGTLGAVEVPFGEVDRILAIGSDRMMAAVTRSRRSHFAGQFKPSHQAIASINSPMQCMMKEICAQCMQRHIDPETGAESYVFSCFNQDQPADHLDWEHLAARLRQNSAQEKVGSLWLEHLLELGEYGEQAEESADQASTA